MIGDLYTGTEELNYALLAASTKSTRVRDAYWLSSGPLDVSHS